MINIILVDKCFPCVYSIQGVIFSILCLWRAFFMDNKFFEILETFRPCFSRKATFHWFFFGNDRISGPRGSLWC